MQKNIVTVLQKKLLHRIQFACEIPRKYLKLGKYFIKFSSRSSKATMERKECKEILLQFNRNSECYIQFGLLVYLCTCVIPREYLKLRKYLTLYIVTLSEKVLQSVWSACEVPSKSQ